MAAQTWPLLVAVIASTTRFTFVDRLLDTSDIFANEQNSIDTGYIDGVSIIYTYGSSPRTHIWTYASGLSEQLVVASCPCGTSFLPQTPSLFVGNNYYCESENPSRLVVYTYEHTLMYWVILVILSGMASSVKVSVIVMGGLRLGLVWLLLSQQLMILRSAFMEQNPLQMRTHPSA